MKARALLLAPAALPRSAPDDVVTATARQAGECSSTRVMREIAR